LRLAIANFLMPSKPTIYLIAGCNGAGKTTFAREFLPSIGVIRFLNADEIARGLSPLKPEAVAFKAGKLLLSELRELVDRHETFALESTLSGRTYVNIFKDAKRRGYRMELHFVWIPDVREAIRRVRQRVIEGGHDVPAEDIKRRFARSIQHLLDDYAPLATRWFLWDNSTPPAKLLAESASHTIIQLRSFFASHEEESV
jgi:predicted ABC-type ATPase